MKHSDYFRGALSGHFKEGKEGVIILEDENPDTFTIFNTWLYTNKMVGALDGDDVACDPKDLACVYLFGDRYMVPSLKNLVIDEVIARMVRKGEYPFDLIFVLYDLIPCDDPMRKLLVDIFVWDDGKALTKYMSDMTDHFPVSFLEGLVMAMAERPNIYKSKAAPWRRVPCSSYYSHTDGARDRS